MSFGEIEKGEQKTVSDMSECVAKGVEHNYQFVRAENGQSTFQCFCGAVLVELEDSQP